MSWTVDVLNPAGRDDFVLGLKEITLPTNDGSAVGVTRPYSMWLSGEYRARSTACARFLSLDMRVVDPAWIGMKLRKLLNYPEPLGDFMAFTPGSRKQQKLAFDGIVRRAPHHPPLRHARHLGREGYPVQAMGILEPPRPRTDEGCIAVADAHYAVPGAGGPGCHGLHRVAFFVQDASMA